MLMFYVRLELHADHVVVRNLFPRGVAYRDIVSVETPPFRDLVISTSEREYRSFAVAKDNISRLLGRRARADEVVDELRRRASLARGA